MKETVGIDGMDQVGGLGGDGDDGNTTTSDEASVAAIGRKYGLTVPKYSSNQNRSIQSTNKGPYRSVLDFDSTEEMAKAMLEMGEDCDTSGDYDVFLQQIADGEPIQSVSAQRSLC